MGREKEDYRENLELIFKKFGNIQLIPLKKAAEYCGTDYRNLQAEKTFPIKKIANRYYVTAVGLAKWLS